MSTLKVTTFNIETWDQLVGMLEQFSLFGKWLFRGQADARWGLKTTLERHTPQGMLPSAAEFRLLREFKRRAHTYLAAHTIPSKDNDGEWMALMQHFGAPTRLLDVTLSPYVATYFAIEDTVSEHCAVWAISTEWLLTAAGATFLKERPGQLGEFASLKRTPMEGRSEGPFTTEFMQGLDLSHLEGDEWWHDKIPLVVPFQPEQLSERLSIQQGKFVVPRDVDRTFMDNLRAMGEPPEGTVCLFLIAVAQRGRILERLRMMNITRAQLFPGLDGFAQSFRQLLLQETVEQKAQRLKQLGVHVTDGPSGVILE